MSDRYFIDQPISADRLTLAGAEAHHLIHVMRTAPARASLCSTAAAMSVPPSSSGSDEARWNCRSSREHINRELPFGLTLGVALPKGDRQKWLVEKAVELGVTGIVPLGTQRGVAQPVEQALARLRRTVIEASKQCGRNRLLQIDEPQAWSDFVAGAAGAACRLLAHPGGDETAGPLCRNGSSCAEESRPPGMVFLAIGPEGGFTEAEVDLARSAGWRAVDLGPRILRVETAAILLVAMVVWQTTGLIL